MYKSIKTSILILLFTNHIYGQVEDFSTKDSLKLLAGNNIKNQISLDSSLMDQLEGRALLKVQSLGDYIQLISNKKSDVLDIDDSINAACKLFINEDSEVHVSNHTSINRRKIRDYFKRLRLLKFEKVEVLWSKVYFATDIYKGTDGNYYTNIEIEQLFRGITDDKIIYEDITIKQVEVVISDYTIDLGNEKVTKWDIKLSDIGVKQTFFEK